MRKYAGSTKEKAKIPSAACVVCKGVGEIGPVIVITADNAPVHHACRATWEAIQTRATPSNGEAA
jgi:hypothetical protein